LKKWEAGSADALAAIAWLDQPLIAAAALQIGMVGLARCAKSSANLLCHARAVSVTARCAAIRSSTARRR
jgi:hypothetical protein